MGRQSKKRIPFFGKSDFSDCNPHVWLPWYWANDPRMILTFLSNSVSVVVAIVLEYLP
jgi:hypothetical protein